MKLSKKMVALRKRQGLTQEQLGEIAGVKKRAIIYYENDQRIPSDEVLAGIATALEVTTDFLLDESQNIEFTKEEIFINKARETYGAKGASEAAKTIGRVRALMAGGELNENDKDSFFEVMQEIYFDSKGKAKKYGK